MGNSLGNGCYYFSSDMFNIPYSSTGGNTRACCSCQGGAPAHMSSASSGSGWTTLPRTHCAALHSLAAPLRQSASPPTRRTSWFGPASSSLPSVLLLLLLPGVNLRRREKKTYPSLSSVRGPLLICLHFPPRRHHWLPCRASQLASFPSPS